MAEIFLSYRRQDSASATGRLADRLEEHFGPARVFRDHDSIVVGDDFAAAIRRAIEASTVVLVIIGPDWLRATLPDGRRRLDDPDDWVRLEVEAAFDANLAVVPVLVEGARMPLEAELPATLGALARCQALELSDTRWRYDSDRLIRSLQTRFAIEASRPLPLNPLDPVGTRHWGGWPARLAIDLLDLGTHPTRLIARRRTGHAIDHLRAFAFLLGALLFGNLMLLFGLDVHPSPSEIGGRLGGLITWLVVGELFGLVLVTLLAIPLTLGWRLTGRRIEFGQVTVIAAYLYGGAWCGFCVGAMVLGGGLQWVDPGAADQLVALLAGTAADAPADVAARMAAAQAKVQATLRGPAAVALVVALLAWIVTAVWAVVAWGSFRLAFGANRLQAAAATLLWLLMLGALVALCAAVI
jgi:hypothetical protein